MRDAVGGSGNTGGVGERRDSTKGFGGLGISDDGAVGGVDTDGILAFALARFESSVLSVVGCVVGAADTVVDVLAEDCGAGTCGVTSFEAESITTHEVMPFNNLRELTGLESIRKNDTTHWVTAQISTMGVHFSAKVIRSKVDQLLVDETDNLNVVWGLHELDTGEGTSRDEAGTTAGLSAPGNHLAFSVGDNRVGVRRGPQAEIIKTVQKRGLAKGSWAFSGRIAAVVTELLATNETSVSIDLFRDAGRVSEASF